MPAAATAERRAARRAEVRRRNSRRIAGATSPPAICAPATMAATSPATPYASGRRRARAGTAAARRRRRSRRPPVNGAASMSQRTAGTRKPYSIETPREGAHLGQRVPAAARREADVPHQHEGHANMTTSTTARSTNGAPEVRRLGDVPAATDPISIATPVTTWPGRTPRRGCPSIARRVQRVDQPGLDGAGEEGEAEAEQQRDDRPRPERRRRSPRAGRTGPVVTARVTVPSRYEPAAPTVRDDPCRHLEQDHAGGEEGVRGEGLEVRQPGVEQEDRVDPPDQRRRERVPEHQDVVGARDGGGSGRHAISPCCTGGPAGSHRPRSAMFDHSRTL